MIEQKIIFEQAFGLKLVCDDMMMIFMLTAHFVTVKSNGAYVDFVKNEMISIIIFTLNEMIECQCACDREKKKNDSVHCVWSTDIYHKIDCFPFFAVNMYSVFK